MSAKVLLAFSDTPFFNEQAAGIVQLFSFPLEILGLTLVVVEIWHPKLAKQYEQFLNAARRNPLHHNFFEILKFLYWLVAVPLCYIATRQEIEAGKEWYIIVVVLLGVLVFSYIFAFVLYLEMAIVLGLLKRKGIRSSLASVGVIQAAIGMIGEAYQVGVIVLGG